MIYHAKILSFQWLLVISLLATVLNAKGAEFKAEFVVSLSSFPPGATTASFKESASGDFFFRNGEWLIRFKTNKIVEGFKGWQTGSDGRLVYQICRDSPTNEIPAIAMIFPGPVPDFNQGNDPIPFLWMAYASHSYLKNRTNDYLPKMFGYSALSARLMDSGDYQMKARWVLDDTIAKLTKEITFMDVLSMVTLENQRKQSPNHKPNGTGFTNAVYKCLTTTNLGDLVVPLTFCLEVYVYHPTSHEKFMITRVEGVTLSATSKCELTSLLPEIPERMTVKYKKISDPSNVTDKRFGKSMNNVGYVMREAWLTNDEELKKLPEYSRTLAQSPRITPPRNKESGPILRLLVGAFFVLNLVFAAYTLLKHKQKTKSEE